MAHIKNLTFTEKVISICDIIEHPKRKGIYDQSSIADLAYSIGATGLRSYPKVRFVDATSKYQTYDGDRRVAACKVLGWQEIKVNIVEGLEDVDELIYILDCNNYREKTPREKYHEIKIYQQELPKRQGRRTDLTGEGERHQRSSIAKQADLKKSQVYDIQTVGEHDEKLLDSIDSKNVYLSSLATKIRKGNNPINKYVAVEQLNLEPVPCPYCHSHPTQRIVVENKRLFFVNEISPAA